MKKHISTIGTVLLFALGTVAFTNCSSGESKNEHNHTDGHTHDHGTMPEKKMDINTKFTGEKVTNLTVIIEDYLGLKNALVSDNSKEASKTSQHLLIALNGFDKVSLVKDKVKKYAEIEESIIENAEHIIKNSGVIDHQREHFETLSTDINDLITLLGTNKTLYLDFCPMANNNKGAFWLSEVEKIKNPYMGSSMLTCGTIKDKIN